MTLLAVVRFATTRLEGGRFEAGLDALGMARLGRGAALRAGAFFCDLDRTLDARLCFANLFAPIGLEWWQK